MSAGDISDGVGHDDDGEAEGQCDTEESDAHVEAVITDDLRGEYGRAATAEDEDEGAEEFGEDL